MMVPAVASKAGATVVACIGLAVNTSSVGGDRLWGFEGAPSPWHGTGRGSILVGGLPPPLIGSVINKQHKDVRC